MYSFMNIYLIFMKCLLRDIIVHSSADLTGNKIWFLLSQDKKMESIGGTHFGTSREHGMRAV